MGDKPSPINAKTAFAQLASQVNLLVDYRWLELLLLTRRSLLLSLLHQHLPVHHDLSPQAITCTSQVRNNSLGNQVTADRKWTAFRLFKHQFSPLIVPKCPSLFHASLAELKLDHVRGEPNCSAVCNLLPLFFSHLSHIFQKHSSRSQSSQGFGLHVSEKVECSWLWNRFLNIRRRQRVDSQPNRMPFLMVSPN